jgi:hypothetical protein
MIQPLNLTFSTTKGDNTYSIKIPNVGEFYDIEVNKQILGNGLYSSIVKTNTIGAQHAADMIDIEAHLSVLCPDLMKDLNSSSFKELGLMDYNEIKKVYIKDFIPWWKKIQDMLRIDENKK